MLGVRVYLVSDCRDRAFFETQSRSKRQLSRLPVVQKMEELVDWNVSHRVAGLARLGWAGDPTWSCRGAAVT